MWCWGTVDPEAWHDTRGQHWRRGAGSTAVCHSARAEQPLRAGWTRSVCPGGSGLADGAVAGPAELRLSDVGAELRNHTRARVDRAGRAFPRVKVPGDKRHLSRRAAGGEELGRWLWN